MSKDPITEQSKIVDSLRMQLEREEAVLLGMRRYAEHLGDNNQPKTNPNKQKPKRRMRLGSKKRVVFHLISDGLDSVEAISKHLDGSDIDRRNVRDIVRTGIEKGDVGGSVDDRFVLTEFGKELLDKASKEEDWPNYSHLISKSTKIGTETVRSTIDQLSSDLERLLVGDDVEQ